MASIVSIITDVLIFFAIYLIPALALNMIYGYTGLPNFGLALSVAGGAYITGFLPGRLAAWILNIDPSLNYIQDSVSIIRTINMNLQSNPLLSIMLLLLTLASSVLVGIALGFVASYPAIRLRGTYLLIVLIAMAEMTRIIGYNYEPIAGGTLGVSVPKMLGWLNLPVGAKNLILVGGSAAIVTILMERLLRSPLGRLLRAIRDEDNVAESLGKDIVRIKMKVMTFGSGVAALSGALHSLYLGATVPEGYTRADWTFWPWLMLMVGGKGNNRGVILGTIITVLIRRIITIYKYTIAPLFPFDPVWLERILLGVTLIVIMTLRPQGIIPEKPIYLKGIHRRVDEGKSKAASLKSKFKVILNRIVHARTKKVPKTPLIGLPADTSTERRATTP